MRRTRAKHKPACADYIIPRSHHHLSKSDISGNALKVLNRLNSAGFQAYLVGGSVRDLLLGKAPKDFDVATNATPTQIRGLFRNGRIIGRRFKLVHVIYHRDIIEVATFRSSDIVVDEQVTSEKGMLLRDNVYGTLDEDAWRRDFTVNSLYYNIDDASIVDFTGGVADVQNRVIRVLGTADTRYQEDPVRMLRAIRFAAKLDFDIAPETAEPIKRLSSLMSHVSNARLCEEAIKLYQCGAAKKAQQLLVEHGLFKILFPQTEALFSSIYPIETFINIGLENTDIRIHDGKPTTPAFVFAIMLWFPLLARAKFLQDEEGLPPLPALDKAMAQVISQQNTIVAIPKRLTQVMREIWLLQFRFSKRQGTRATNLLEHPRFRAAYDFLALRALSGDESMELADWWTTFQDCTEDDQQKMVAALQKGKPTSTKKKRKSKPSSATTQPGQDDEPDFVEPFREQS